MRPGYELQWVKGHTEWRVDPICTYCARSRRVGQTLLHTNKIDGIATTYWCARLWCGVKRWWHWPKKEVRG